MQNETTAQKCKIERKKFLAPCEDLVKASEHPHTKTRGIRIITYTNITTHKTARIFATLRSGEYTKTQALVEFCPFCGVKIGGALRA